MPAGATTVREAIAALPPGALAVALSGGLDSTVLLHAAARGRPEGAPGGSLRALHVNHGLRAEAAAWQRRAGELAQGLGVPFVALRVAVAAGNLQAQARRARYQAWRHALRPGELLLLAHHADDQAETVLWQLASGRAPVGMPRARPLGAGRLLRPFLNVRRATLAAYADAHHLAWAEDPSNADTRFDRVYIRREVMPRLAARFPNAVAAIAARVGEASPAAARAPLPTQGLDAETLGAWLGAPMPARRLREVLRQAAARADAAPVIALPDGRTVRRHDGRLHLVGTVAAEAEGRAVQPGEAAALAHGVLSWRRGAGGVAAGHALALRYRRGAERMAPVGRGVTKTLKDLFREAGVPPWRRGAWPLLFDGEALAAVPGIAVAASHAKEDGWLPAWTPADGAGHISPPPV